MAPSQPTYDAMFNNLLEQANRFKDYYNNALITQYKNDFNTWKISVDTGKIDNTNPPQVPDGYGITQDSKGWPIVILNGLPVCNPLPIPPSHFTPDSIPGTMLVGVRYNGNWFTALQGDTFPVDKETPPTLSKDGVFGVFKKYSAPTGGGWYYLEKS